MSITEQDDKLTSAEIIDREILLKMRTSIRCLSDLIVTNRTREFSLVITKLEEASMWLGKDMTNRGIFKPYTDEQQTIKE